ncbi:MAG: semialdehyde dehydrogenase [Planctomycetes bacterium]|nr:semialdehyde dehydrogenase [Planctomycetota bacterium]
MTTVALIGAGGKMGCRITDNLKGSAYDTRYVEVGPAGIENLRRRGLDVTPREQAVREADAVILAVPDNLIERISAELVPSMRPGSMLVVLDAAAPYAGKLPARADVTYVVTHPCHPSVFNVETDPEAQRDYFGGIRAKQSIVCALMQGPEADYGPGEALCRTMFAPVERAHRVTVDQMIILEPVLSETTAATCITVIREAMEESIRRGVPRAAARDFILGHLNIEMAIVFEEIGSPFSDGAKKAIEKAKGQIFRSDWKKVFDDDSVRESVELITRPPQREPAPALRT